MSFRTTAFSVLAVLGLASMPASSSFAADIKTVTFSSDDGVALSGLMYGAGSNVVILSHQYDLDQTAWADLASSLADQGYGVLTYNFRGYPPSGGAQDIGAIGHDLDAAIAFAKEGGATKLVLGGASMGGIVTVPAAVTARPEGYVTLSAPLGFAGLAADDASLAASDAGKLFINTEGDDYIADTRHMFEAAARPKSLEIYPGNEHAMSIFPTDRGEKVRARIIAFINTVMPLAQ